MHKAYGRAARSSGGAGGHEAGDARRDRRARHCPPERRINSRPEDLAGKRIGLFSNRKRAAQLTLSAVERELLERYPTAQTSWYACSTINTPETLTEGKAKFEAWVSSVDAVVLSVAD